MNTWRRLFHRRKREAELDSELRHHLELEVREHMNSGLSEADARRQAALEFGGLDLAKEECREVRSWAWLETLAGDLRYAIRTLRRSPAFAAAAIVTLALGIGATTAIFSVVDAVLLRPLPYPEPERLVRVLHHSSDDNDVEVGAFSREDFADLRQESSRYESLAAYSRGAMVLTGGGEPLETPTAYVSPDFFSTLRIPAALGRTFAPEENVPGADTAAVLSHEIWRSRFGSSPEIVGDPVTVDGETFTVVGIMPPAFEFPAPEIQVWLPVSRLGCDNVPCSRGIAWLEVIGRLAPGASRETANQETHAIIRRLAEAYPETNGLRDAATVAPLQGFIVSDVRPALLVLFGAVALVLLIACVNVANLLLARGATRERELAMRAALGAGRLRVVRQLLTESLVLAVAGGAIGFMIAVWGVDGLVALGADSIPRWYEIQPDLRLAAFALAASLLTGLLFGLIPALTASKVDFEESLKAGGRSGREGGLRWSSRGLLIGAEMAMAVVLLAGAGLLIKSFWNLTRIDLGFSPENVLAISVNMSIDVLNDNVQRNVQRRELVRQLESLPGVVAVGGSKDVPLQGTTEYYAFSLPGRPDQPPIVPRTHIVMGAYFRALGIPLVDGRVFTLEDEVERRLVVVVNQAMARRYWPDRSAVGESVILNDALEVRIVGVVGDVRHDAITQAPEPAAYVLPHFGGRRSMHLYIRTASDPLPMAAAFREAIWDVNPDQPVTITTLRQVVAGTIRTPQFLTLLLGAFAGLAVVLALIGVYGVTAYAVSRRTYEVGIRLALGARTTDVLRLFIVQGLAPALAGLAIGIVAARALTRLLSTLLYGVDAADPAIFTATAGLLMAAALLAVYIPARRATRVDPMVTLQAQ